MLTVASGIEHRCISRFISVSDMEDSCLLIIRIVLGRGGPLKPNCPFGFSKVTWTELGNGGCSHMLYLISNWMQKSREVSWGLWGGKSVPSARSSRVLAGCNQASASVPFWGKMAAVLGGTCCSSGLFWIEPFGSWSLSSDSLDLWGPLTYWHSAAPPKRFLPCC